MKSFLQILLFLLIIIAGVVLVNTFMYRSAQLEVEPFTNNPVHRDNAIEKLSGAVRIPTISHSDNAKIDTTAFKDFISYVVDQFPNLHEKLESQRISGFSLLYRWEGQDTTLAPIMLTGHYDVVPPGDTTRWEHPPFSGITAGGYIWGRGTMDDKVGVIGIMDAVETLLEEGFQPQRTIYLAFGHDEEVGGMNGAAVIADTLSARGVTPQFVADEGMMITEGLIPGIDKPVALIAVSEKGYLSTRLTAYAEGGHSSTPPRKSAVGSVSRAVVSLEQNQFSTRLTPPVEAMFSFLGPEMPFIMKMMFANRWLFDWVLKWQLGEASTTNALVRTTTAPTMFHAGEKDNVLPTKAEAIVNFRILQGDSEETVMNHVKDVVNDTSIEISKLGVESNPRPVAEIDGTEFELMHRTVKQIYPDILVSPGLLVGGSDGKHYAKLTPNVYSFNPYTVNEEDIARYHGLNERIGMDDYHKVVFYFYQLIKNSVNN